MPWGWNRPLANKRECAEIMLKAKLVGSIISTWACPDYGIVLDDDAKAFFTAAESFAQLQVSEASSQYVGFDRSTERSTGRFSGRGTGFPFSWRETNFSA